MASGRTLGILLLLSAFVVTTVASRARRSGTGRSVPDTDSDGIPDHLERSLRGVDKEKDTDGDGIPDYLDPDDDNDGIPDSRDADRNGDGIADCLQDQDGDGIPDYLDADDDGDGVLDADDRTDTDGDGIPDDEDPDDDNDGIPGNQLERITLIMSCLYLCLSISISIMHSQTLHIYS